MMVKAIGIRTGDKGCRGSRQQDKAKLVHHRRTRPPANGGTLSVAAKGGRMLSPMSGSKTTMSPAGGGRLVSRLGGKAKPEAQ